MGETLALIKPSFNQLVEIELCFDHITGDTGALVQREISWDMDTAHRA